MGRAKRTAPVLRLGPTEGVPDLRTIYGLGEGTAQLAEAKLVPIAQVKPNPDQPRKTFDAAAIEDLAGSIRVRGILQPLRLRRVADGYQIVAGERRWRAARLAGLTEVPAIVVEQDEASTFLDALIENVVREDLNPFERADAVRRLRSVMGLTNWDDVAAAIGVGPRTVYRLLGLQELPPQIQEDIRAGELGLRHADALRSLRTPELQEAAYRRIVDEQLSGDEALALARELRQQRRRAPRAESRPSDAPERLRTAAAIGADLRALVRELQALTPLPRRERTALLADIDWVRQELDALRSRLAP